MNCCDYPQPMSLAATSVCGNCGEDLLAEPEREWTAITGPMVFFPGDLIRATVNGLPVEGVIEDFEYDVLSVILGAERTTAVVRLTQPCGALEAGATLPVPLAAVTEAAAGVAA